MTQTIDPNLIEDLEGVQAFPEEPPIDYNVVRFERARALFENAMCTTTDAVVKAIQPEPGNWRFGELEDFPARIAHLSREIVALQQYQDAIKREWAKLEKDTRLAVAQEIVPKLDSKGVWKNVPVYSNDFERNAELQRRLDEHPDYRISQIELEAAAEAIERLEIERTEVLDHSEIAKLRYNRAIVFRESELQCGGHPAPPTE